MNASTVFTNIYIHTCMYNTVVKIGNKLKIVQIVTNQMLPIPIVEMFTRFSRYTSSIEHEKVERSLETTEQHYQRNM